MYSLFRKAGFLILILLTAQSYAQENDYEYTVENIWGINKNTASGLIGGFIFKYSSSRQDRHYATYGLELIAVKHPAEAKLPSSEAGSFYVVNKMHHLYAIRGQYGRDITLFKKAPQQGVQVNLVTAIGPSIGLEAPYYIAYGEIKEPFDPNKHSRNNISGKGYPFQGVFNSTPILGVNLKAGFSFEFGTFKSNVSGFEIGFLIDAYPRKIEMMAYTDNYAIWPTAYIDLFYGSRK